MQSGDREIKSLAVDKLFSYGLLPVWYGKQTPAMTEFVREHIKLDETKDEPIPDWLMRVLVECTELGPKYRIRLAVLHHQNITGKEVKAGVMSDSESKIKKAESDIASGKIKPRTVPKPAFAHVKNEATAIGDHGDYEMI